jgi:hypothetical protein
MSQNVSVNQLTANQENVAAAVAAGDLTDEQVAEIYKLNRRTITRWRRLPQFAARVAEIIEAVRITARAKTIASKEPRIDALIRKLPLLVDISKVEFSRQNMTTGDSNEKFTLKAERVVRVVDRLKQWGGTPQMIRLDNGPELTSVKLQARCESMGVELKFIQPGKPNQNAFIERFNRTLRPEVLNAYIVESLDEVREMA